MSLDLFNNKFTIWHLNSKNNLTVPSTMIQYILIVHKHTDIWSLQAKKKAEYILHCCAHKCHYRI